MKLEHKVKAMHALSVLRRESIKNWINAKQHVPDNMQYWADEIELINEVQNVLLNEDITK